MKANIIVDIHRANYSRIANKLKKREFKSIKVIVVTEQNARKRDNWVEVQVGLSYLDDLGFTVVCRKTATRSGRSRVYVQKEEMHLLNKE